MTKTFHRAALPLLAAISLTACNASETNMTSNEPSESSLRPVAQGRGAARLNPSPKRGYGFVVTIENAPGPFGFVKGGAQYDVSNDDQCGHKNEWAGVSERITSHEDVALTKVSDTEYRGVVYLDGMLDEDYYGRGVCHWELTAASVVLRATGDASETRFMPTIPMEKIVSGGAVEAYFWKGGYPRDKMDNYPDYGHPSVDRFKPEIRNELFKVTIRAQGPQP